MVVTSGGSEGSWHDDCWGGGGGWGGRDEDVDFRGSSHM